MRRPDGDIWIFAYGSLMWRPEFPHVESRNALLHGYHRALCIKSVEYRGTADVPGLVFGLDRGGSCRGRAFRVLARDSDTVIDYLYEREMVTGVYRPRWREITTDDGGAAKIVTSFLFVADPAHPQYVGKLNDEDVVRMVLQGHGKAGPCIDYLINTFDHLTEIGIHDRALGRIINIVKAAKKSA